MPKVLYPTVAEQTFMQEAIAAGALSPVDGQATDSIKDDGIALVMCPDNNHWDDIITHLELYLDCENVHPVPHLGGAMVLDPTLTLVQSHPYLQKDLYWQICQAKPMKEVAGTYLMAHMPCGVARLHQISPEDQVRALINGKRWLRGLPARPPHMKRLGVLLHFFDGGPDPARSRHTYHMATKKMEEFLSARGYPVSELLPVPA